MNCYLFLLLTLILWAVIPNVALKYVLVEVKEFTKQEANKGIIYSTSRKHVGKTIYLTTKMIH